MAMLGNTQSVHLFDQQNGLIGNHTCKFHEACIYLYPFLLPLQTEANLSHQ